MVSRKEAFAKLRELLKSAESNYDHGRHHIGQKKLIKAYNLLGSLDFFPLATSLKEVEG